MKPPWTRRTPPAHEPVEAPTPGAASDPAPSAPVPQAPEPPPDTPQAQEIRALLGTVPGWFHSIDVGAGVVTPGAKPAAALAAEFERLALPDLHGLSVLDIGAWDGYFSFEAERRGAARVVALDHYAWSIDWLALGHYNAICKASGTTPAPSETLPEVWRPDTVPGKAGFDLAHRLRGSKVESIVGDFMTVDFDEIGTFDVVLFLGVLYHLRNPVDGLARMARAVRRLAVIETVCAVVPGMEHHALAEFLESDELDGDPTNWWAPNRRGIEAMARCAGFDEVRCLAAPPPDAAPGRYEWHYGRAVFHALKAPAMEPDP